MPTVSITEKSRTNLFYDSVTKWRGCNPTPVLFECGYTPDSVIINTFTNVGGLTGVNFATIPAGLCGNRITISDSNIPQYNGTFDVVFQSTLFAAQALIDVPFAGAGTPNTATLTLVYQNAYFDVNVYVGVPNTHPLATYFPFTKVANLQFSPNPDKKILVDIAPYVRAVIANQKNSILELLAQYPNVSALASDLAINDVLAWRACYIEMGLVWDDYTQSNSCTPVTNQTSFVQSDTVYCVNGANPFEYGYGNNFGKFAPINSVEKSFFLLTCPRPTIWLNEEVVQNFWKPKEIDLAFISPYDSSKALSVQVTQTDFGGGGGVSNYLLLNKGQGVYRFDIGQFALDPQAQYLDISVFADGKQSNAVRVNIVRDCQKNGVYVRFLNQFGAWEGWIFSHLFDTQTEIETSEEQQFYPYDNVLAHQETSLSYVKREQRKSVTLRTYNTSTDVVDWLAYHIKKSVLVQIVDLAQWGWEPEDVGDTFPFEQSRRTILVDSASVTREARSKDKVFQFTYRETSLDFSQGL